ncbi:choice-of-anchor L domain-containing protein [Flavobacterium rakeshii]|uniref:choice-of-anchor L domain-containing protein n=1 Tax=Flavobacterium rakeshii TaxID=1038845 RepID=UPI002E7C0ECB|nr:choice-of-anchor L domain-containing protein [Flavobacterium rakeshii]MEE1897566.1 choice-of-anchor L domain-containing protein [Flavobacterium rakeshii]
MKKILLLALWPISLFSQAQYDTCENALTLNISNNVNCTNPNNLVFFEGNTLSDVPENCLEVNSSSDMWFEFTPAANQTQLELSIPWALTAPFSLYRGDCNSLTQICLEQPLQDTTILTNLIPGETYKIRTYAPPGANSGFSSTICLKLNSGPIIVSDTQYTTEELITDVFFNSECVTVSNITSYTGTANNINGIGYFNRNATTFPLDEGIVLASSDLQNVPGPNINSGGTSDPEEWLGDEDLENILSEQGITFVSKNASLLEFDFAAIADRIDFDIVLASDEYGIYQCLNNDAIAILLTDLVTNETVNLAVVPGTESTPISTSTIRDNQYASNCSSENAEFFGQLTPQGSPQSFLTPTNFNGSTIPLHITGNIVPGHNYHLKLVISDGQDTQVPSAVFLTKSQFNYSALNAENIMISSTTQEILCTEQPTILSINLEGPYDYQWYLDDMPIENATEPTYTVTSPGQYSLRVNYEGTTCHEHMFEYYYINELDLNPIETDDIIIYEDNTDGFASFDLIAKAEQVLQENNYPEFEYTIYISTTTELTEGEVIYPTTSYTNLENPQTLYAITTFSTTNCHAVRPFQLRVIDSSEMVPQPDGDSSQTFTEGATLADLVVVGENIQWYDSDIIIPDNVSNTNDINTPLPITTLLVDGATYYASQTINGIESVYRLAVTVHFSLDIASQTFISLTYYPNPVSNILTLSNANTISTVEVYNLLGQKVFANNFSNTEIQIDLSNLETGIYMVKVSSLETQKTIRIQKQ